MVLTAKKVTFETDSEGKVTKHKAEMVNHCILLPSDCAWELECQKLKSVNSGTKVFATFAEFSENSSSLRLIQIADKIADDDALKAHIFCEALECARTEAIAEMTKPGNVLQAE